MPTDLGDGPFDLVGVLEDHHGLGGDGFRQQLWLLPTKVLLEQIDLVVLPNALLGRCDQVFRSLSEAQCRISVQFLQVLADVTLFSVV